MSSKSNEKSKKALVLIDFQKEWTTKGSEYYIGNIGEVIGKTNLLVDYCKNKDYKVIFTKHVEKEGKAFRKGKGAELIPGIHLTSEDKIIEKNKISPFYKTSMEKELNGIKEVIICGILTNLCVRSFVQDAYDRDFEITIVKDCCAAFDNKTHEFTLKDLRETRPEIKITNWKKIIE